MQACWNYTNPKSSYTRKKNPLGLKPECLTSFSLAARKNKHSMILYILEIH